jgi:hypothetical protein
MNEHEKSAVERAQEYGIDITLLESSLKLTVDQRLQRLQDAVDFFHECEKAREAIYGKEIGDEIKKLQEKWRKERSTPAPVM